MKKILILVVLPVLIIVLGFLIYKSIQQPVEFEKQRKIRETICIERLKDIRTLQVAYKSRYNKFTSDMDSLIDFYNNGTITIIRQIGSFDDSVAVAQKRVFRDSIPIAVKDTLLKRAGFNVDSLAFIPFSGGEKMLMKAIIAKVSGVDVPLFEASAPYDLLLKGLERQLVVNLNSDRDIAGRYPGMKVGSIDAPNNNAGNWE
ncbi:MAG: hypothetical protein A2X19_06405 [Bacteroidetes bacterium GWE2_39_28]|nr:MAG: hypothetical protein A2X19_06405 [Bacteroidetes bacterium GWE2_39_28]OFY12934.1 MAG: hypothetical protein A2X16_04730 [Bacteroidetes bacterium GWF2_39_10]OFZ10463.1 MAG: hypothetical protein A2465_01365 [Bacteroidetes bacterium RIFOXYC2_FULL_39_11]HCT93648.1 hypothetical protein [Rikenellaceae bacterium]